MRIGGADGILAIVNSKGATLAAGSDDADCCALRVGKGAVVDLDEAYIRVVVPLKRGDAF